MTNTLKITLLSIAIISAPLASFVANEDMSKSNRIDLPEYTVEEIISLPQPVHYPVPSVSKRLVGTTVKLRFTVNEKGRPEGVRLEKYLSNYRYESVINFASQLKANVSNWKFEPAQDKNGNAIVVKVIMPVHVVKKGGKTSALASLMLDDSSKRL